MRLRSSQVTLHIPEHVFFSAVISSLTPFHANYLKGKLIICFRKPLIIKGRFPFNQEFRKCRNVEKGTNDTKIVNLEIVEFPKTEPFNWKFLNSCKKTQMDQKFRLKISEN